MAWLIGLTSAKEAKELVQRGWTLYRLDALDNVPFAALRDNLAAEEPLPVTGEHALPLKLPDCTWPGFRMIGTFVDQDLFVIMNGPDWNKEHLEPR